MLGAWKFYNEMKKKAVIPNIRSIETAAEGILNIRNRALLILSYFTAGRVNEIVGHADMLRSNIGEEKINNRPILVIKMPNEKNKNVHEKALPIPIDLPENKKMIKMLDIYLKTKEPQEALFEFGSTRAWQILIKHGFSPHSLRFIRGTHLVTMYSYSEQELIQYMGWSDGRPAKVYIQLRMHDLVNKMKPQI